MYIEDIKLFAENYEKWENTNTGSENIQSGHRDGLWHGKRRHANNENQETTHDGRSRIAKSRKTQNARRRGNLQILGNIGS